MDIFKKQVVVSSKKQNINSLIEIDCFDYYVYCHKELKFFLLENANNKKVLLLGNAFCTDVIGKNPNDDIKNWDGKNIRKLTSSWVGRWALLTSEEIVSDACSSMGLYYYVDENGWTITSSLATMQEVENTQKIEYINNERPVTTIPYTILNNVKKLMPFEKIKIGNSIEPVFESWFIDYRSENAKRKCEMIASRLINAISNISIDTKKPLYIALTGGRDSRQIVAALLNTQIKDYTLYTLWHKNISKGDKKIPKQISSDKKIKYRYIDKKKIDKQKSIDYIKFTCDNIHDADEEFYSRGLFEKIPSDAIVIKGGHFELGQNYYRTLASKETKEFHNSIKSFYKIERGSVQEKEYTEWAKSIEENPVDIDIRDRFYLEQRICGWASYIDQSSDINDFITIQIADCQETLSVLLSANEQEREKLELPYGVIEILDKELLNYPVNPESFKLKIRRWIGKILK